MKLGIVGWRGMVGQVLMGRILECNDLENFDVTFFSTSNASGDQPFTSLKAKSISSKLADAYDLESLKKMDIILTCQGGDYTQKVYKDLRSGGYKGYWIDAASTLRMSKESLIALDPVNLTILKDGLRNGVKDYIGGNCTVSLMLMGLSGLFKHDCVEWISSMTYQAASGGGARHMNELLFQMKFLSEKSIGNELNLSEKILEVEKKITNTLFIDKNFPKDNFQYPLACNLLPWIDSEWESGQSKEEWKAMVEANKILQTKKNIPIDGTCVRVSSLRCHAQGLTIKLKNNIPIQEIEQFISEDHEWVKFVKNNKPDTLNQLTPASTSGSLTIPVGRVRKMNLGDEYLNVFTIGDQLLWGAAEPLRRMLRIIEDFHS